MGSNSTKAKSMKVIQGRKAEVVKTTETLTHEDIKCFFLEYAGAIVMEQERVNKILIKHSRRLYDDKMYRSLREDCLTVIVALSLTVDKMPKRLLKNLTELAITRSPDAVKRALYENILNLANIAESKGLIDTASRFFSALIKDVIRQVPSIPFKGTPEESMLRWFDYETQL